MVRGERGVGERRRRDGVGVAEGYEMSGRHGDIFGHAAVVAEAGAQGWLGRVEAVVLGAGGAVRTMPAADRAVDEERISDWDPTHPWAYLLDPS